MVESKAATDIQDNHKAFHNSHRTIVDDIRCCRFNVSNLAKLGPVEYDELLAIDGRIDQ